MRMTSFTDEHGQSDKDMPVIGGRVEDSAEVAKWFCGLAVLVPQH